MGVTNLAIWARVITAVGVRIELITAPLAASAVAFESQQNQQRPPDFGGFIVRHTEEITDRRRHLRGVKFVLRLSKCEGEATKLGLIAV